MNICFFLDTSVLIGMIFPGDHWEGAADRCMHQPQKKYTSVKVEGELRKKVEYAIRVIRNEMSDVIYGLRKKKPDATVREADFQRMLDKTTELKNITYVTHALWRFTDRHRNLWPTERITTQTPMELPW